MARISDDDILRSVQYLCFLLCEIRLEGLDGDLSCLLGRLQPLRSILFWLPSALLDGEGTDETKAAILALMYSAGLCLEQVFADICLDLPEKAAGGTLKIEVSDGIGMYLGAPFLALAQEAFQVLRSLKGSENLPQAVSTVEQVLKSSLGLSG